MTKLMPRSHTTGVLHEYTNIGETHYSLNTLEFGIVVAGITVATQIQLYEVSEPEFPFVERASPDRAGVAAAPLDHL